MNYCYVTDPSASSVESGSSFLVVSGRRKTRTPLITTRQLKTEIGMDQWYTANILNTGDNKLANLKAKELRPTAVCLRPEQTISSTCLNKTQYFRSHPEYLTEVGNIS